jgi:hypothetical protein
MKNLLVFVMIAGLMTSVYGQTIIATSNHSYATAHHNQRKIVRDSTGSIYIAFVDFVDQTNVIKGVVFDGDTEMWGEAFPVVEGMNPTLAISNSDIIYLLYQTNDATPEIRLISSSDFIQWTDPVTINDLEFESRLPVADCDSAGNLNIFWKQKNEDLSESLIYARFVDDELADRKTVFTKNQIDDFAIANHLLYVNNGLYFAVQFDQDSIGFFFSDDLMESYETLLADQGAQPCITYNSEDTYYIGLGDRARFLFINSQNSKLYEAEVKSGLYGPVQLPFPYVHSVCIDNLAPPIGYSFLYSDGTHLFHGFSYGVCWTNWVSTMETITGDHISHPSIAYKRFNFEFVDFIWMEGDSYPYEIHYMRDAKHIWTGLDDPEHGKGFSIVGSPNPFTEQIAFAISTDEMNMPPELLVYDASSRLVKTLPVEKTDSKNYMASWSGTYENGSRVRPGVYILLCTVGNIRTARKVVFRP